jgi:hypothetical protein
MPNMAQVGANHLTRGSESYVHLAQRAEGLISADSLLRGKLTASALDMLLARKRREEKERKAKVDNDASYGW